MNFFSHIKRLLDKVVSGIAHIFSEENIEKAERIGESVSDLAALALPYVEKFANLTEGTEDDELVAAATKMNRTVNDILHEPDADVRRGLILGLVGNATKAKIAELVENAGGQKIKLGNISIRVPDDIKNISSDLFDLAAQAAYTLFIKKRPA